MNARLSLPLALFVLGPVAPQPPGFSTVSVMVPGSAQRLAAGDLDGDGKVDLLVLSTQGSSIPLTVLHHGAGHSFMPQWMGNLGISSPTAATDLDLSDLDHDGDLDAIAAIPFGTSVVRMNAGNATFDVANPLTGGGRVQHALAQLNLDSAPDLVAYEMSGTGLVDADSGVGDGNFVHQQFAHVALTNVATRAELGDVTGDGVKDLVRVSSQGLEITPGVPGAFQGFGADVHVVGDPAFDFALGDLDADGRLDAITTVPASGALEVFRGQPGGLAAGTPFPGGVSPGPLALADLDADGFLDAAYGSLAQATVTVNAGSTGGIFFDLARYRGGLNPTDLIASDLDGDGDQDLAETTADGRVVLLFNKLVP
jgi:hypothetical protein